MKFDKTIMGFLVLISLFASMFFTSMFWRPQFFEIIAIPLIYLSLTSFGLMIGKETTGIVLEYRSKIKGE